YDSYFKVIFEDNVLEGEWIVPSRGNNYQIHFVAKHGQDFRFTTLKKKPITDVSGKWDVTFELDQPQPVKAIGYLHQDGNHLTGTFETEVGDYRYLEGTVQANKLYLSCFDGSHMFLFEALIEETGSLSGVFRSGIHYITSWEAQRNDTIKLRNPNSITTSSEPTLHFSFPDETGKVVDLNDAAFQGKPKIIQLMGTWCSNCLDETEFIRDYLAEKHPDLVVIALAFERHKDPSKARAAILRYREKVGIDYPILLAGTDDKKEASAQLPMLNEITAYPTLIFLDRSNRIKEIHTGFSGPATPSFADFKKDFENMVHEIISDNI
ncbi:MAG: TlpA family protein disulfide reductase, partial [Saprospiraceae bacterium]|nr:TlpA family protein disulfide reductase [Saprospiraceae bacterium]